MEKLHSRFHFTLLFWLVLSSLAVALAACSDGAPRTPKFHKQGYPEKLSDWGVLRVEGGSLRLSPRVRAYDLATPLFSDYALKLRTITLPRGKAAVYAEDGAFEFPVGTIVTKTFYFPYSDGEWTGVVDQGLERTVSGGGMSLAGMRLIETRILARREEGWVAIPYVWNEEQTEATLARAGKVVPMTLHRRNGRTGKMSYLVPNTNQCAGCHATDNTTRVIQPIGLRARHLNKISHFSEGFNQLAYWRDNGLLTGFISAAAAPRNADWRDETVSVEARARAYLDINCSHCHSDVGPADTSGLDLRPDTLFGPRLGVCKSPIAAGGGSGGRAYDIVPGSPDDSITVYRIESTDPGAMMPELGRSVVHQEGAALIRQWIAEMTGACN